MENVYDLKIPNPSLLDQDLQDFMRSLEFTVEKVLSLTSGSQIKEYGIITFPRSEKGQNFQDYFDRDTTILGNWFENEEEISLSDEFPDYLEFNVECNTTNIISYFPNKKFIVVKLASFKIKEQAKNFIIQNENHNIIVLKLPNAISDLSPYKTWEEIDEIIENNYHQRFIIKGKFLAKNDFKFNNRYQDGYYFHNDKFRFTLDFLAENQKFIFEKAPTKKVKQRTIEPTSFDIIESWFNEWKLTL